MLRPKRAYKSTFKPDMSSLMAVSFSSNAATSSSIFSVDDESSSCTSASGRDMNESPTLYLTNRQYQAVLQAVLYLRDQLIFVCKLKLVGNIIKVFFFFLQQVSVQI